MPRSSNLDTVAPDDPVVNPTPAPSTTPAPGQLIASTIPDTTTTPWSDRVYSIFGHTKSPFSSSLIFPHVFHFAEQDDNEKILIALRPHWFP